MKVTSIKYLLFALAILSSLAISCNPRIFLVLDGQPLAKIVVPYYNSGQPDPCLDVLRDYKKVCEAAVELQAEIAAITTVGEGQGVILPIESDSEQSPADFAAEIHLGDTACRYESDALLPFDQLEDEESFFIHTIETEDGAACSAGKKIFISQKRFEDLVFYRNHGYGTMYGVYEFMESELGVHWYLPGPLGKVSPTGKTELTVRELEIVANPSYVSRELSGLVGPDIEWAFHNRLHNQDHLRWQFYHNVNNHLKAQVGSDIWKYYPDLWTYPTLPNGQPDPAATPYIQAAGTTPPVNSNWQPRMDVDQFDTYLQVADRLHWYTANNTYEAISVGIMDSRDWHAPTDLPKHYYQFTEAERDVYGIAYSGINRTLWRFLEYTTNRWLTLGDHDNQWICTLAYNNTTSPPDPTVNLPSNLIVLVGGDRTTTWLDSSTGGPRDIDRDYMLSWAQKVAPGGRLAVGEKYWGSEMFVPRFAPGLVVESLRWSHNELPLLAGRTQPLVEGFRAESWPIWTFDGPKFWIAARALWDVNGTDAEADMASFIENFFGAAAEPMAEYFQELERLWNDFPADFPELYEHHTTRAQRFDRGDTFQWVEYPANIINYRDEPGILEIYRQPITAMLASLQSAKEVFEEIDSLPLEYYRVLIFERAAKFVETLCRFQEVAATVEDGTTPYSYEEAEVFYNAFVQLDDHFVDCAQTFETMCHPPPEQLPDGIADDEIGIPRWGETYYEKHFKDYLPTIVLKLRCEATIAWYRDNGYSQRQQQLQAIYDRIFNWSAQKTLLNLPIDDLQE